MQTMNKLREALESITLHFCRNCPNNGPDGCELSEAEGYFEILCHKLKKARAALSAPPEPIGNWAKIREALELVAHMNDDGYWNGSASICNLVAKANAALSAPARNCDRFRTKEEAALAYAEECNAFIPQSVLWQIGEWLDWLFAEAKGEQK